jgi:hypothetical protein
MYKIIKIDFEDSFIMDKFISLPWDIYPKEYKWIPPLKDSIKEELSGKDLFFEHGEAQGFLCISDDKAVGRIVASIDHNLKDKTIGHFGYFEVINDPEAASLLISAAEKWLYEKGKTISRGPINLTTFNQYRIQTNGFDTIPFFKEVRNPEYYPILLKQLGYKKAAGWDSRKLTSFQNEKSLEYLNKKSLEYKDKNKNPNDYIIRHVRMDDFENEIRRVYPCFLTCYSEIYGFSQISENEFVNLFKLLPLITVPEFFNIVEHKTDGIVAFGFCYFNVARDFINADGDMNKLHFSKDIGREVIYSNFGIAREHRGSFLTYEIAALASALAIKLGCEIAYNSLAVEGRNLFDCVSPEPIRKYELLEHKIDF